MKKIFLLFFIWLAFPLCAEGKKIVFQPTFHWTDRSVTPLGTSSFVKGPKGTIFALTSAHFLDFSHHKLLFVECMDIPTDKPIAVATKCYGNLQHRPNEKIEHAADYFLMKPRGDTSSYTVLEMDERDVLMKKEAIYFPNKNEKAPLGFESIDGEVIFDDGTTCIVMLKNQIDLTSRSGTPVISKMTGKVVGILAAGGNANEGTVLYLTKAPYLRKALEESESID